MILAKWDHFIPNGFVEKACGETCLAAKALGFESSNPRAAGQL